MSDVKIKIAAGTNVGLIRQNNEDNFVVSPDLAASGWTIPQAGEITDLGEMGALLVVADGMGGANAGEVASAIAIDTIQQMFSVDRLQGVIGDDEMMKDYMVDAVKAADINIINRSRTDVSSKGMGTTIVLAWLYDHRAYVCWCGDSRCYLYRKFSKELHRLSHDHSYVQELVDRGELNPELASEHPLSNVITRCLGSEEKRAVPETHICELQHGDIIMLCSDGLCSLCHDDQIANIISERCDNATDMKDDLITAALSAGGYDNVTVTLAIVEEEQDTELTTTPDDHEADTQDTVQEKESETDETITVTDDEPTDSCADEDKKEADKDSEGAKEQQNDSDSNKEADDEHLLDTQPCAPVKGHGGCFRWLWALAIISAITAAAYYAYLHHLI